MSVQPSFQGEVQFRAPETSGIYAIEHVDGKRYIGSAVNLRQRWKRHRADLAAGKHHSILLQRAWEKYGPNSFRFMVLESVASRSDLIAREQHFLDLYRSYLPSEGYNVAPTAGSSLGVRMPEQAVEKLRQRLAKGHPMKGRRHTEDSRAKMSASRLGVKRGPYSDAFRQRMSEVSKGRVISQAQRDLISRTLRGRKVPREVVEKIAAANTGQRRSEDVKRRIAASNAQTKMKNVMAVVRWAFYAE